MSRFTWGVDGYGRQFICEKNGRDILLCVIQKQSPKAAIEELEKHGANDTSKIPEIKRPQAHY